MNRLIIGLASTWIGLNVLDVFLTIHAVGGGLAQEMNPIAQVGGIGFVFALKLVPIPALLLVIPRMNHFKPIYVQAALIFMVAFMMVIIMNNLVQIP